MSKSIAVTAKFMHLPIAWFKGKRVFGEGKRFVVEGYGTSPSGEDCVFADGGDVMLTHRQIEDWEFPTGDGMHPLVSRDPASMAARKPRRSRRRKILVASAE